MSRAAAAEGAVVALEEGENGTWFPVVRFDASDGRTVTFRSGVGASPPSHSVGERVPVLYDPARPEDARIATTLGLWFVPLLLGGVGLLPLAVAARVFGRRRQAAPQSRGGRSDRGLAGGR